MAQPATGARIVVPVAVGALIVVWLAGLVWFRPWIAHNDFAIFRIALERELDGHVRLVGAHSRLDVFHPGPLREWAFALPYWIGGRRASVLPATSLVLNAAWSIWIVMVARRLRPRAWGVACAAGLLVVVIALGADLASPWNPHLAILPVYVACWSTVTVVARNGEGWVAAVVAASFAAQLHASALVLGGALLLTVLISLALQRSTRAIVGAVAVGVLLWSGPIVDLRKGADANLVRLATVGADGSSVGLADAIGHVSRLTWPGTPLGRVTVRPSVVELSGFHRWWLLLVVVALGAAAWWSIRRLRSAAPERGDESDTGDDALPVAACAVAIGVVLIAIVTVSVFVEPAYRYLYGPLQGAAVFVVAVLVAVAASAVERAVDRSIPEWVITVAVPVLVVLVFLAVPRFDGASEERSRLEVESAVGSALAARPTWRTVEALPLDLRGAGDLDAEVLDVVVRSGVDARSRRTQIGLPAPVDVDGVLAVAMAPALECLEEVGGIEVIVRGATLDGVPFAVVAVDRDSDAYRTCVGDPAN